MFELVKRAYSKGLEVTLITRWGNIPRVKIINLIRPNADSPSIVVLEKVNITPVTPYYKYIHIAATEIVGISCDEQFSGVND